MQEYQYTVEYLKGKKNVVADHLSQPVLIIQRPPEVTYLGKSREEMRLQREEQRWNELITYLEGGRVPRRNYKHTTLDQFPL